MALVSFPFCKTLLYLINVIFSYSCVWVMSFLFDIVIHICDSIAHLCDSSLYLLYYYCHACYIPSL